MNRESKTWKPENEVKPVKFPRKWLKGLSKGKSEKNYKGYKVFKLNWKEFYKGKPRKNNKDNE